jgi:GntR family transcriptional regulator
MNIVDKNSPIPAYYQIHQYINDKIKSGEWKPGNQIPTERELTDLFGVSRMTLRHALTILSQEGVIVREVGRGSYVAEPKITQTLKSLTGFSQDMIARGKRPDTRVLEADFVEATPALAEQFGLSVGSQIFMLKRLRLADHEPMSLEIVYLSIPNMHDLINQDLSRSLYELLKSKYGVFPTRAKQKIQAGLCEKEEAEYLAIEKGQPVLRLNRYTFDQDNRQFEAVISVYRGDRYVFDVELITVE